MAADSGPPLDSPVGRDSTMRAMDQERLVIGRFARRTGLSVGALRHYDELDLLRPAWVDPETGYRSYRADQLETARTIVRLRDLELPLDGIRDYLGTDDPAARRRIMEDHRRRIQARVFRLQGVLHIVGQLAGSTDLSSHEAVTMTAPTLDSVTDIDPATHRRLALPLESGGRRPSHQPGPRRVAVLAGLRRPRTG